MIKLTHFICVFFVAKPFPGNQGQGYLPRSHVSQTSQTHLFTLLIECPLWINGPCHRKSLPLVEIPFLQKFCMHGFKKFHQNGLLQSGISF